MRPTRPNGAAPAVLITGAAAGIGRATALQLAQAGWRCMLVDADDGALARLVDAWPPSCETPRALVVDLTDAERIQRLALEVPKLDALINNAGLSTGGLTALQGDGDGATARLLALNLDAPARLVKALAPRLRTGARVVNVASGAGLRAVPWRGLYSPSKAGLIAQSQALARARPEWTVTTLAPGFVRTALIQQLIDQGTLDPARVLAKVPMGRMAEPAEIADGLCFLTSPGARALHGQVLVLDGGSFRAGNSLPLPPAEQPPRPFDLPTKLRLEALDDPTWRTACEATFPAVANGYDATLDAAACAAPEGQVLHTVRESARRFQARHPTQASLTLLLPTPQPDTAWHLAGDAAATDMLIATLAAEWGALGLRINALQLVPDCAPHECLPLLAYMAGARAQFLTGQVIRLHIPARPQQRPPTP